MPVLGQGMWHMAENPAKREQEIAALRLGLDLGMTLVDKFCALRPLTAQIYTYIVM